MKPETLSVRAVNQYRRRDFLAYLGLRYYLENEAAKRDIWSKTVATHLVNSRTAPIYFHSYHFKEVSEENQIVYRSLYLPGPNEILAETSLLYECSMQPSFKSLESVYSYHFPKESSKEGVFRSYFPRYKSRHQSIAKACLGLEQAVVQYTDIRKFYPSISIDLAKDAWKSACESSNLSYSARQLGERLLNEHFEVITQQKDGSSILTGPMFSHLIANLVLFKIDNIMHEKMNRNYWRYVDDVVLVGNADQINKQRELLQSLLNDLGLSLHDEKKDFVVDSETWLEGINDFNDSSGNLWINLVSNIKRFLIAKPESRVSLLQAFSDNGISLPIMDYSSAVLESSYIDKFKDLLRRYPWFPRSVRNLSIQKLVRDAVYVRNVYQEKITGLLESDPQVKGYKRKRLLPKLRFYANRLSYLSTPEALDTISAALANYPEMLLEAAVMQTLRSKDVTALLKYGANAVQAAAQIFHVRKDLVDCSSNLLDEVEIQGVAILKLNGVDIRFSNQLPDNVTNNQLIQFANGENSAVLMKSNDFFIKEIACLRGVENLLRHQVLLGTAFDRDEHMAFDVIDQLQDSSYF